MPLETVGRVSGVGYRGQMKEVVTPVRNNLFRELMLGVARHQRKMVDRESTTLGSDKTLGLM